MELPSAFVEFVGLYCTRIQESESRIQKKKEVACGDTDLF